MEITVNKKKITELLQQIGFENDDLYDLSYDTQESATVNDQYLASDGAGDSFLSRHKLASDSIDNIMSSFDISAILAEIESVAMETGGNITMLSDEAKAIAQNIRVKVQYHDRIEFYNLFDAYFYDIRNYESIPPGIDSQLMQLIQDVENGVVNAISNNLRNLSLIRVSEGLNHIGKASGNIAPALVDWNAKVRNLYGSTIHTLTQEIGLEEDDGFLSRAITQSENTKDLDIYNIATVLEEVTLNVPSLNDLDYDSVVSYAVGRNFKGTSDEGRIITSLFNFGAKEEHIPIFSTKSVAQMIKDKVLDGYEIVGDFINLITNVNFDIKATLSAAYSMFDSFFVKAQRYVRKLNELLTAPDVYVFEDAQSGLNTWPVPIFAKSLISWNVETVASDLFLGTLSPSLDGQVKLPSVCIDNTSYHVGNDLSLDTQTVQSLTDWIDELNQYQSQLISKLFSIAQSVNTKLCFVYFESKYAITEFQVSIEDNSIEMKVFIKLLPQFNVVRSGAAKPLKNSWLFRFGSRNNIKSILSFSETKDSDTLGVFTGNNLRELLMSCQRLFYAEAFESLLLEEFQGDLTLSRETFDFTTEFDEINIGVTHDSAFITYTAMNRKYSLFIDNPVENTDIMFGHMLNQSSIPWPDDPIVFKRYDIHDIDISTRVSTYQRLRLASSQIMDSVYTFPTRWLLKLIRKVPFIYNPQDDIDEINAYVDAKLLDMNTVYNNMIRTFDSYDYTDGFGPFGYLLMDVYENDSLVSEVTKTTEFMNFLMFMYIKSATYYTVTNKAPRPITSTIPLSSRVRLASDAEKMNEFNGLMKPIYILGGVVLVAAGFGLLIKNLHNIALTYDRFRLIKSRRLQRKIATSVADSQNQNAEVIALTQDNALQLSTISVSVQSVAEQVIKLNNRIPISDNNN